MHFFKPPILSISLLTLGLLSFSNVFANSGDPLSLDEISNVTRLASPAPTPSISASASLFRPSLKRLSSAVAQADTANKTKEVLLVERHEEEKGADKSLRRADIFTYDYQTNELIETLVDLNTSEVIRTKRSQGTQLPLTEAELERAKKIVFDDEDERQILEYEYHRLTSKTMTDTSDLNIKAFSFIADSLPNRVNEASKLCGIHRCAQLMLYTSENIVFEVTPIVNLSEGIVTQRIGF